MRQLENQVKQLTVEKATLVEKINSHGQFSLPFETNKELFLEKLNQGFSKKLIK